MEHISKTLASLKKVESESLTEDDIVWEIDKSPWPVQSGIPSRFRHKTFAEFEVEAGNKEAFDNSQKYAEEFPLKLPIECRSLGIFSKGIWGVGKTHLVCAIALRLMERCRFTNPVLYMTEPDMLRRIRKTYDHKDGAETESEVMTRLTTVPLLIIDDVGKEEIADPRFVQRVWFSIINSRYDNMLPVIITANLDPNEIEYYLGGNKNNEATFDRLFEMLEGVFFEIKGRSHRRGKWTVAKQN